MDHPYNKNNEITAGKFIPSTDAGTSNSFKMIITQLAGSK
jgi:hypothetical protein